MTSTRSLAIVAGYAVAAAAVLGRLWADPGSRYLVDGGQDQNQWEWFFAVTADAVARLENPLFTTLQNHPDGVNLMANTTMLGLAVPLTPLTLLAGPSATWALVLTGGLAGTAAAWYLLIRRHLGLGRAAAGVGGGLCAFAPPVISHANAHPNFVALFAIPLIIGRILRLAGGGGRVPRDGATLGLLAAYQVFLGEEALLLAATGLGLFALGYATAGPAAAWGALGRGLGVAAAIFVPLVCYPLAWQFTGPQSYDGLIHGPSGNDVAVLPAFARQSLAGHVAPPGPLAAGPTEQNAFFGWPLLLLTGALAVMLRRSPAARALAFTAAAAALLSLGPEIVVYGHRTGIPGPWLPLSRLPLYESVLESRLALVAVPAVALLLALGTERMLAGSRERRLLWCLALAQALLPIAPKPLAAHDRPETPRFFAEGGWRRYVEPGRAVVPVPLPDAADATALRWQVAAGLRFPVPEGYFVGPYGPDRAGAYGAVRRPTSELLRRVRDGADPVVRDADRVAARADLAYWRADAVVLGPHPRDHALRAALDALLGPGRAAGGVRVWDVRAIARGPGGDRS